ncbi:recombinase family protein [Pedobacter sp. Leaf250]|uniref:recombinase family protein n=1 Tax=Pedobacter sp. Leaf250 TaxID=2876559 RepID=UPI001E5CF6F3|nr:recombinase family protein [Pedobacter sp. Leaf250]
MKWVFRELERGNFSGENILNAAREKGLECSKNNFYTCIRNTMYCGRIVVPRYKDEPERTVQGQHEALITETQFYNVQQILDSRKRETGVAITTPSEIVLRGFLMCPNCGKSLTASSSRGKKGYYTYYHCTSNCGSRFRAEKVNADFETELLKYLPREGVAELFIKTITDQYKSQTFSIIDDRKDYIKQIEDLNKKIDHGRGCYWTETSRAAISRLSKVTATKG